MQRVSEILSKPVLSLYEAQLEGVILEILFDKKLSQARLLVLLCEEENQPEKKYIEPKNVFYAGEDVFVIKNSTQLKYEWQNNDSLSLSPMNAEVFNTIGKNEGRISDIVLDDSFCVVSLETSKGACFVPSEICSLSSKLIVVQDAEKPVKILKPAQKKIPKIDNRKTVVLDIREDKPKQPAPKPKEEGISLQKAKQEAPQVELRQEVRQETALAQQKSKEDFALPESYIYYRAIVDNFGGVAIPERIPLQNIEVSRSPQKESSTGYGFLIGKTVMADIVDNNGSILIPQGTIVELETIETAKSQGRVVQLALSSK